LKKKTKKQIMEFRKILKNSSPKARKKFDKFYKEMAAYNPELENWASSLQCQLFFFKGWNRR